MKFGELGGTAKLVILYTLSREKTLYEIGDKFYTERTKFYQPKVMRMIEEAIKNGYLFETKKGRIFSKTVYKANTNKIIQEVIESLDFDYVTDSGIKLFEKYKKALEKFYIGLGNITQRIYLDSSLMEKLIGNNLKKFEVVDLGLILQLPFILKYYEKENPASLNLYIKTLKIKDYWWFLQLAEWQDIYNSGNEKALNKLSKIFKEIIEDILPLLSRDWKDMYEYKMEAIKKDKGWKLV
jgi:hypothetical protein